MAQISIYMDADTVKKMKAAAAAEGMSVSAWLVRLVKERIDPSWPAEVAELAGSWEDFPSPEELRSPKIPDGPRLDL